MRIIGCVVIDYFNLSDAPYFFTKVEVFFNTSTLQMTHIMNSLFGYQSLMYLQLHMKSNEQLNIKNKNRFNMIKAIKNFMLVMLLSFTTIANASIIPTVPYVMFEQVGEQKVRLNLTNLKNERPQLSIIDAEENILYSESIRKTVAFTKAYDFSTLENGTYTIKLELDDRIVYQEAIVEGKTLTLANFEATAKPIFKVFKNAFDVYISGIVNADVSIEIMDDAGETVHEKFDESVNGVYRQYVMKNLPSGEYLVKVTIDERVHYKSISL